MNPGIIPPGGNHPKTPTPVGEHGFYLPRISIWNMHADQIMKQIFDGFESKGSVDDYVLDGGDGNCDHCGTELIRVQITDNVYFLGGPIYCPKWDEPEHPREYWIEVWPNANEMFDRDTQLKMDKKELDKNAFKLSNPIIRPCYSESALFFHRWREHVEKEWDKNYEIKPFPEPLFLHE